ncbi:DNA polymerase delta subunit 3 [Ctenocephalides felis]|uniref:DNA polymerase delta subunit 3 n=1 Tax=Ctenocephalides felis TaxID=7515 RepID=UPI000E6E4DC5|nr:DNA polymerase delta subunit 3 [Ctenocephalides felis]
MLDEESRNIFLQNLDEFILDEEKIVTARWLSKTLNINYKDSTAVLTTWIEKKKDAENLLTTYAISGKKEDGSLIVTVLRDYAVDDFVQNLTDVSKSVYSAQKGVLKNIQLLAAANENYSPCLGGIIGPTIDRKITPSIAQEAITADVKPDVLVPKLEKQSQSTNASNNLKKEPESLSSSQKPLKNKEISKGGIANFFNKQSATSAKSTNNVTKKGETKSINNFFKKTSPKSSTATAEDNSNKVTSESVAESTVVKTEIKTEENLSKNECISNDDVGSNVDDDVIPGTPQPETKLSTLNKIVNKKKSKRARENSDEDNLKKRRKRVYVQSDSSDDDIFGNESEDEKMEQEPAAESNLDKPVGKNIVEELANTNTLNKKKKKIVDKMYTDEDGFIITCKEVEECSASEEEEEPPAKKAAPSPPKPMPKKINPGTKQANLMSFFKKK